MTLIFKNCSEHPVSYVNYTQLCIDYQINFGEVGKAYILL